MVLVFCGGRLGHYTFDFLTPETWHLSYGFSRVGHKIERNSLEVQNLNLFTCYFCELGKVTDPLRTSFSCVKDIGNTPSIPSDILATQGHRMNSLKHWSQSFWFWWEMIQPYLIAGYTLGSETTSSLEKIWTREAEVYWLALAAITNYLKLCGLRQCKFIISQFCPSKFWCGSLRAKSRHGQTPLAL